MDKITFKPLKPPTKAPRFQFQESCLELIKEMRLKKADHGLVWALYKRKGITMVNMVLAEWKQGEIKGDPVIYLKWSLKTRV